MVDEEQTTNSDENAGLKSDLLAGVDAIDVELAKVKSKKVDWQNFLSEIKKNRKPTIEEAALYIKNMNTDERALFASALIGIDEDYPSMSSVEKKIMALELSVLIKEADFERHMLALSMRENMNEYEVRELEVKSRVHTNLIKKRGMVLGHLTKQKEISNKGGSDIADILNNPEVVNFRMEIQKRSAYNKRDISEEDDSSVINAEYKEVD